MKRRMRPRSTLRFGARTSWRRDGGLDSERVGGNAPQGLGAAQSYSEAPEVKHNNKCTSKITSSSSGLTQYVPTTKLAHFLLIIIYVLHTKLTAYATFCHSDHSLWIHIVHSFNLKEFTSTLQPQTSQEYFIK